MDFDPFLSLVARIFAAGVLVGAGVCWVARKAA